MGGEEAAAATGTGHRAGHEEFPGNSDKGRSGLTEVARGSADRVEHRIAAVWNQNLIFLPSADALFSCKRAFGKRFRNPLFPSSLLHSVFSGYREKVNKSCLGAGRREGEESLGGKRKYTSACLRSRPTCCRRLESSRRGPLLRGILRNA